MAVLIKSVIFYLLIWAILRKISICDIIKRKFEVFFMNRILDRKEASSLIEELKNQGKKVVFTNGCFDILHVGHLRK